MTFTFFLIPVFTCFVCMDHYYNSSACFYREVNCIFQAKNDGYIFNNLCLDPWILCQIPPIFSLGHTLTQPAFQRPVILNTSNPSYQHGLGSSECSWLSVTYLILQLVAQKSPPLGSTAQANWAVYSLMPWAFPALHSGDLSPGSLRHSI